MSKADAMIEPMDIHELIGAGVRAARERRGWRQEDAAREFRRYGLTTWRRTTVADMEAGRRHPSIGDLLLVAQALDVAVADLIPDAGEQVDVGDGASMPAAFVRALLSGNQALDDLPADDYPRPPGDAIDRAIEAAQVVDLTLSTVQRLAELAAELGPVSLAQRLAERAAELDTDIVARLFHGEPPTEAEVRAASRLDIDAVLLKLAVRELWGHSFEAERDARARADSGDPPSAIQARRGHATRAMLAELRTFIDTANQELQEQEGNRPDASDQDD